MKTPTRSGTATGYQCPGLHGYLGLVEVGLGGAKPSLLQLHGLPYHAVHDVQLLLRRHSAEDFQLRKAVTIHV